MEAQRNTHPPKESPSVKKYKILWSLSAPFSFVSRHRLYTAWKTTCSHTLSWFWYTGLESHDAQNHGGYTASHLKLSQRPWRSLYDPHPTLEPTFPRKTLVLPTCVVKPLISSASVACALPHLSALHAQNPWRDDIVMPKTLEALFRENQNPGGSWPRPPC